MAIQFYTDIFPLFATKVITEAEYAAVDPTLRDTGFEQGLLTLIEVMRSFMVELPTDDQSRVFKYAITRMLAATPTGHMHTEARAVNSGNIANFHSAIANGDTISITVGSATDAVVMAAAPYVDMNAVVADINSKLVTVSSVEAFVSPNGRIGFRNAIGYEGSSFTIATGAGPTMVDKMGIEVGPVVGTVEHAANLAQTDALNMVMRPTNVVHTPPIAHNGLII